MNLHLDIHLFNKPHILSGDFALRISQCEVKPAYQFWDELGHFHHADILPNAGSRTVPELYVTQCQCF
jgi:hypothetical protein